MKTGGCPNSMNHAPTKDFARRCAGLLSVRGPFARLIEGYGERRQQLEMTARVAAAVAGRDDLVVEAGTGIGKTFAYLVPAVLSGRRTIISTATRHLQDQIYYKDLPVVRKALGATIKTALLKGRANYLCLERLEYLTQTPTLEADAGSVELIRRWSRETDDGDVHTLKEVAEDDPTWPLVLSTPDSCLGANCPHYRPCFVAKARQRAARADLVVVNHHLLMADMALKEEGFMELLPGTDVIVVDEAHQFKGVAERNFTERLTSRRWHDLLRDCEIAAKAEKRDDTRDDARRQKCLGQCRDALGAFTHLFARLPERGPVAVLKAVKKFDERRRALADAHQALVSHLKPLRALSEHWASLWQRVAALDDDFERALGDVGDDGLVAWFSHVRRSFQLYLSPCDVSALLSEKTRLYDANWIYTSATIAVGDDFTHFRSELGLAADGAQAAFDSPFDYREQAALYLPRGLPEPNNERYTDKLLGAVEPLLAASNGRAFLLFTSHHALRRAAEWLDENTAWQLLVQGSAPKMELIRRFGDGRGRLLLGTNSFWEGVDVKGAALSCVVIDRLPFASPGDPVVQAKIARAREQERNYFVENTLPEAVLALRQGVGRLIRDAADSGVIVIGDCRVTTRPYGRIFLDSLPPMKVFRELAPLRGYFQ